MERNFLRRLLLFVALVVGAVSGGLKADLDKTLYRLETSGLSGGNSGGPSNKRVFAMSGTASSANGTSANSIIVGMTSASDTTYTYSLINAATNPSYQNGVTTSTTGYVALDGVLTVSGVVTFYAPTGFTLTVSLFGDTVLQAADMAVGTQSGIVPSMIVFNAEGTGKINVYVDHDLIFTGSNPFITSGISARTACDLVVAFSGTGQTSFLISDSHKVEFGSLKATSAAGTAQTDLGVTGSGTKAYVMMDHASTSTQATVIFQRRAVDWAGAGSSDLDYVTTGTSRTALVAVGLNSIFTFITDNSAGLERVGLNNPGDEFVGDYGSVAFDVSNTGSGRVALWLKGRSGFGLQGGSYDDAAFVVRGHVVCTSATGATPLAGPGSRSPRIGGTTSATWANAVAKFVNLHRQGGVKAYMRIINDVAQNSSAYGTFSRGLLVINDNASFPALASGSFEVTTSGLAKDLWNDSSRSCCAAAASGSVKNIPVHGFILGDMGEIRVSSGLFFDYVGTTTPHLLIPSLSGFTTLNTLESETGFAYKRHNPSALIVDGSTAVFGGNTGDLTHGFDGSTTYTATGRNATISLLGTAKAFFRSGTATSTTTDHNVVGSANGDPLSTYYSGFTLVHTFTIATDVYDGLKVADTTFTKEAGIYNSNKMSDDGTTDTSVTAGDPASEGFHIIDVEGKLTIQSLNGNADGGSAVSPAGTFNIPSIAIDSSGAELQAWTGTAAANTQTTAARPLTEFTSYPRYQTSSILLNADMVVTGSTTFLHNDVARDVHYEGSTYGSFTSAAPAIVGGESAAFKQIQAGTSLANVVSTTVPMLEFINSNLDLQESLAVSGVRLVSRSTLSDLTNTSSIVFYHHTRLLDLDRVGRGRVLVLGSELNRIGDQGSFAFKQYGNQDFASINVFNHSANTGSAVTLCLTTSYGAIGGIASNQNEKANHILHLAPNSYIALGWTTTVGANYDPTLTTTLFPWNNSASGSTINQFKVTTDTVSAAQLEFRGEMVVINGERDYVTPPTAYDEYGVVYANYGGEIFANASTQFAINYNSVYPMGHIDTSVGVRIFGGTAAGAGASGIAGAVDVTQDQVTFARGLEYYNLDLNAIFSNAINSTNADGSGNALSSGVHLDLSKATAGNFNGDVRVSWNKVANNYSFVAARSFDEEMTAETAEATDVRLDVEAFSDVAEAAEDVRLDVDAALEAVDAVEDVRLDADLAAEEAVEASDVRIDMEEAVTAAESDVDPRATPIPVAASTLAGGNMPIGMLQVSAGQVINQLRVAGSTIANPFHLYITGTGGGSSVNADNGQVYEVVSDYFVNGGHYDSWAAGAGQHGCIFMDQGGRLGLGSRNWNQYSNAAWNRLGKQYVTLYPNGDCVVDLNNDIIVTDNQALIPTQNFGSGVNTTDQRITFYAQDTHEIRIPAGVELDLSAFGQPTTLSDTNYVQKIELGGKVRMVFEAGSKLRFPTLTGDNLTQAPVLYLNDESELIFEGTKQINKPIIGSFKGIDYQNKLLTKIMGCGQIWVNKNAKIKIFNEGLVSVGSDATTPVTNVAISIQRQGQFLIGDETNVGGSFYVGNLTSVTDASITFSLIVKGSQSEVTIGRSGFLGLGAGIFDQAGSALNDWLVQGLNNVDTVTIQLLQGTLTHNQLFDGASSSGSVIAVGPTDMGANGYFFALGKGRDAVICGGGNLLYVTDTTAGGSNPAILSVAGASGTDGNYSLLGTTEQIRQMSNFATDATARTGFQTAQTISSVSSFNFARGTSEANIYDALRMPDLDSQSVVFVSLSRVPTGFATGYILVDTESAANITRDANPVMQAGEKPDAGLRTGSLRVVNREAGAPSLLALP